MSRIHVWSSLAALMAAVMLPSPTSAQTTRLQEHDPAITYLQNRWYDIPDPRWTDGEALGAFEAGSTMTVSFSGTGITWIGYRCACAAGTARLYLDGQFVGTVNTYAATPEPQAEIFGIDGLPAGQHSFTIEVTGSYHAAGTSAYMLVDAFDITGSSTSQPSDTVPPQVSVTSPSDGADASGVLWVTADASDNVWVQSVHVLVDGVSTGTPDTAAPYAIAVDTGTLADGARELTVVATDWAGNTAEDAITVQVANSGYLEEYHPSISYTGDWIDLNNPGVSGGSIVGSFQRGATATVNFSGTGITWIGYRCPCAAGIARVYLDDALVGTVDTYAPEREARAEIFSSSGLNAGEHVLRIEHTGNYHNQGSSAYLLVDAFRIANGGGSGGADDITPPVVRLVGPFGATLSGTVTISVDATDNTGVAGVQFLLDGEALGAEDTGAPYSLAWDTTTAAEGRHVLSARARDEAGNTAEVFYPPSVTVDNAPASETTPPTVSFDGPPFGTTVTSGTVTLSATAADDTGVARLMFAFDGLLIAQDTSAPYTATWSTQGLADGGYVLRASAVDHDGNEITSAAHILNVWNSSAPTPSAVITAPADGATVSGIVTITGEAFHPSGIESVMFNSQLDSGSAGGASGGGGSAPPASTSYTRSWNTTQIADGTYRVWMNIRGEDDTVIYSHFIRVVVDN
ncbi:MAG TPA: Ig-like domain-containing protein [Pseudomonadales bacterium]